MAVPTCLRCRHTSADLFYLFCLFVLLTKPPGHFLLPSSLPLRLLYSLVPPLNVVFSTRSPMSRALPSLSPSPSSHSPPPPRTRIHTTHARPLSSSFSARAPFTPSVLGSSLVNHANLVLVSF